MRCVDKGIAVHDAIAEEFRLREAGDHAENALLLTKGEVRLKTHEVVGGAVPVLGAQLDRGPGPAAGPGVGKADGLHGTETDRVDALACDLLCRLTCLEQVAGLEILENDALRTRELMDERLVLFAVHRRVEIVAARFGILVARLRKQDVHIERRGVDDGRCGIEKGERLSPDELEHAIGKGGRAERSRCDDDATLRYLRDLSADDLDVASGGDLSVHE